MPDHMITRLGIFGLGVVFWFFGARDDNAVLRWVGIAAMAVAFLMRFANKPSSPQPPSSQDDPE